MSGRLDYEERKEKRIEKYQERAEKAKEESNAHYEQYKKMTDVIPLGQPILTDHYSARATRNGYKKMNTQFDKSIKADEKAKYYEEKITTIEENKAISSDDPKAIEKLEQKLEDLENYKAEVKAREHAPYELQNLNQEMRRIKVRIKELKEIEELDFKDIEFAGGKVIHNKEINRIQFIFEDKPDEEIRAILKRHSFKWAKTEGAWQRLFNKNGIRAVKYVLKEIERFNFQIPKKIYYFAEGHTFNPEDKEEIKQGFSNGTATLKSELVNGIWTENYAILISQSLDNVKEFCKKVVSSHGEDYFSYIIECETEECLGFLTKKDWFEISNSLENSLVQDITSMLTSDFESDILDKLSNITYSVEKKNGELIENELKVESYAVAKQKIEQFEKSNT